MDDLIKNGHEIEAPDAPVLKPAAVDPTRSALLVLDLRKNNCNAEQYTVWHLANSPGTKKRTTLTRMNMISL